MKVKLTKNIEEIFDRNEFLYSVEAFKHLSPADMAFVVMVADYNSPLRGLMLDENLDLIKEYEILMRMQAAYNVGAIKGPAKDAYVKGRKKDVENAIRYYERWQDWDTLKLQLRIKAGLTKLIDQFEQDLEEGRFIDKKNGVAEALKLSKDVADVDKAIQEHYDKIPDFVQFQEEVIEKDVSPEVEKLVHIKFNPNK